MNQYNVITQMYTLTVKIERRGERPCEHVHIIKQARVWRQRGGQSSSSARLMADQFSQLYIALSNTPAAISIPTACMVTTTPNKCNYSA